MPFALYSFLILSIGNYFKNFILTTVLSMWIYIHIHMCIYPYTHTGMYVDVDVFDVKMLEFGVNGQERILEVSSGQKGGFLKAWGQDPWAETAALGVVRMID